MTIAACYLSPEGVVLGADSTSTYVFGGFEHHFDYAQKIFEIGERGTIGVVTWGLGGLSVGSHRTLTARLADDLRDDPAASVEDVAKRWAKQFWSAYSGSLTPQLALCHALSAKTPYGTGVPGARTLHEERVLVEMLGQLVAGFCIGGYVRSDRRPAAFEVIFYPMGGEPTPVACRPGHSLWGIPAFVLRLITGCAEEVRQAILASGKWQGTESELNAIILQHCLAHPPTVPIREAIDFVHTCLLTTIKAMKFSQHAQRCGGPIEIAVMTTDRPFRWVLHKTWDSAIREGEPHDARVIPNTAGGWAATNW